MIEVAPDDPAFEDPTKFVGPVYDDDGPPRWRPRRAGSSSRTAIACGGSWRRRVPRRIFELRPIKWLLEQGTVVICAGGGGIPTTWAEGQDRILTGIEAVIDKDLASELLARELDADLFVMATDVDAVYDGWGTPEQRKLTDVTPEELRRGTFAAGSMGPKVAAAAQFVEHTGRRAAIGALRRHRADRRRDRRHQRRRNDHRRPLSLGHWEESG